MKIERTERFEKDYSSFHKSIRDRIRHISNQAVKDPRCTNAMDDPHELEQFSTEEFQVWSWDITHWDRLVYEIYRDNSKIVFTNCKNHKYRGKRYSFSTID